MLPMKAILLDGSHANDSTGARVGAALTTQLQSQGWTVEQIVLREQKIGNRAIAAAIVASDLLVYLTPVTFGGYSSALKQMVDHQIQNISPFFAKVAGETHHYKRYSNYPDFLAVGWLAAPDAEAEALFRHLVQRNAINFYAKQSVSAVILATQSNDAIAASAQQWLTELKNSRSVQPVKLPTSSAVIGGPVTIRRSLLLVGSPKTRKSTSNALGGYLFEQLSGHAIQTETIYLHTVLHSPAKTQALLEAVDAADLVTLAFPLYVDSLPAPVIAALERIAAHRQGCEPSPRPLFTAIANCGFPEAQHCTTALAICATFARQAGFAWAGGLAVGGGEMVNGAPLAQAGGRTIRMRQALDLAAAALVQGQAIPKAAQAILDQPVIPHWVYRLMGGLGWLQGAQHYGALKLLLRKPYSVQAKMIREQSNG